MLQIAVTGKPNVGKSSFFNSATASQVEMANYPFTTIDANKAVAHVLSECSRCSWRKGARKQVLGWPDAS